MLFRTNATVRSTRSLSVGARTRAESITNPRVWAYSTNAWLSQGSIPAACSTIVFMLSGITTASPPKNIHAASNPAITSSRL